MPRYIDAEILLNELQEELEFDTSFYTEEQNKYVDRGLIIAIRDTKRTPTADVVLRTEVSSNIQSFAKKLDEIYNRYVFEDTDYAEDDVAIECVMNALTDVINSFDEFLMKYMKGGNE